MAEKFISRLSELKAGCIQSLEGNGCDFDSMHQWSQPEIDALTLAWACRRPLLVRGEPGTGKTQLARAVALHLGWTLHGLTVQPRMEPHELVYRFDAVRRLADAQAQKELTEHDYWEPGPLWKAYGWKSATQYGYCRGKKQPTGHVVLIDEIDKADSDLPNSLLEVLGGRQLTIAPLNLRFGGETYDQPPPLVIITTNEEREMPAAFLRRCVVLNLAPPGNMPYANWLVERGQAHFGPQAKTDNPMSAAVMHKAAAQLVQDRENAQDAGLPPPGPAEFLDLLTALHRLAPGDEAGQLHWLDRLNAFAYLKHATQDQAPELSQAKRLADRARSEKSTTP